MPPLDVDSLCEFEIESNTLVVGPTSSGKTTLLKHILEVGIFEEGPPKHIFIVVPEETESEWKDVKDAKMIVGENKLEAFLKNAGQCPEKSVVIFDDFMLALDSPPLLKLLKKWFYAITHRRRLWTFFVTHDMFHSNLLTIRRNTQNFILFNVLQSDHRSATEFITRLLGTASGSAFMILWQEAIDDAEKGWIRLDQKIHREDLKTVISCKGVSKADGVLFAARSTSLEAPLMLDAVANPAVADNLQFEIPERDVIRNTWDNGSEA